MFPVINGIENSMLFIAIKNEKELFIVFESSGREDLYQVHPNDFCILTVIDNEID